MLDFIFQEQLLPFSTRPQKSKRATQIPEIIRTIDREGTIEASAKSNTGH